MADLNTSKAAAWANHADKARVLAASHESRTLGYLQRVTSLKNQVEQLLAQVHIGFRWVGTRLDLVGPDGQYVIGPDLVGTIEGIESVPGLEAALEGKQAASDLLTSFADLDGAEDAVAIFNSDGDLELLTLSAAARSILDDSTVAAIRATLAAASASDLTTTNTTVSGLASDLAALAIVVAGKAAAVHTHTATQISDSTATGRSVLTAEDAAAARTAIGAVAGGDIVLQADKADQATAEAASNDTDWMTALKVGQSIDAVSGSQTFTASGTFTKPTRAKWCLVELWGGGGSGAKGTATQTSGGAGGGYAWVLLPASALAASTTVTIGAGGTGPSAGGNGTAGGDSTFGAHLTAKGGNGGITGSSELSLPGGSNTATSGTTAPGTIRNSPVNPHAGYGDHSSNAGGNTINGGGGGGGPTAGPGGVSLRGGNGGAGVAAATAGDGVAPGGGGGGTATGTRAGHGARGECRVFWW